MALIYFNDLCDKIDAVDGIYFVERIFLWQKQKDLLM